MIYVVFLNVLVLIVMLLIYIHNIKRIKKTHQKLKALGFDVSKRIDTGKYVTGHPDLTSPLIVSAIFPKDDTLKIFEYPNGDNTTEPVEKGTILKSCIKNILLEDKAAIENRIINGRLLAFSDFAFTLKSKNKTELTYLTIQWDDGRFGYETYFEFEGNYAKQRAKISKKNLIKIVC